MDNLLVELRRQEKAVLREYEHALRLESFTLAKRILEANPDLRVSLDRVWKKVFTSKERKNNAT